jgi:hypothetical protein
MGGSNQHRRARGPQRAPPGGCIEHPPVSDTTFILISIAFFAICAAYAYFCEKVR